MKSDELYYAEASRRVSEQEETRRHFQTMSGTILGLAGALIGIMSIVAFEKKFCGASIWLAVSVFTFFIATAIFAISGIWADKWDFNPSLRDLHSNMESGKYNDQAMGIWVARQISIAADNNEPRQHDKAVLLRLTCICFALQAFALGVLVIYMTF